jgi:predicted Zn-dependent protease
VEVVAGKSTLLARVALLGVATIACAWFALGAFQVHSLNRANALLPQNANVSPPQARAIADQLDRAGTLNPDRAVDVLRAELYIHAGNRPAAESLVKRVLRDEPDNIDAWFLLQIAAFPRDPATVQLARKRQRELDPPVPAAP